MLEPSGDTLPPPNISSTSARFCASPPSIGSAHTVDCFPGTLADARADQRQRYKQRRDYSAPMSANELAGAIGDCVRSSADGLVSQVSLQIVSKCLYRSVAFLRILLQRLRDNRVEVTAQ